MTNPFAKPSEIAGSGDYFNQGELSKALGVLFEPKKFLENQQRFYKGAPTTLGTNAVADITIFEDQGALDSATPTKVLKDVVIEKDAIVNTLSKANGPLLGRVAKVDGKNGGNAYWSIVDAADDVVAKAADYYAKREAAKASAPSFG